VLAGHVYLGSSCRTSLLLAAVHWLLRVVWVSLDNHSAAEGRECRFWVDFNTVMTWIGSWGSRVTAVTGYCRQMSGDGTDRSSVAAVQWCSCGHSGATVRAPSGVHWAERGDSSCTERCALGTARRQFVHRAVCMAMGGSEGTNSGKTEKLFITNLVYKHILIKYFNIFIKLTIEIRWRRWKGSSTFRLPELLEYLHMKAAKSSALCTDRLYLPDKMRLEGLSQWPHRDSNPRPSRLVALRLNQLCQSVPTDRKITWQGTVKKYDGSVEGFIWLRIQNTSCSSEHGNETWGGDFSLTG
jgi:hypothetical protein